MTLARIVAAAAVALVAAGTLRAQETLSLSLDTPGEPISYQLRRLEQRATGEDEPATGSGAVATARRISRHLADGNIEEAALLSNSPKRRFEVLTDYRDAVGLAEFKRVYAEFSDPRNPLVAEIAIGSRRALIWRLGPGALAVQYYVDVDGNFLLDDVPSPERALLRRVVEAYRSGQKQLPD